MEDQHNPFQTPRSPVDNAGADAIIRPFGFSGRMGRARFLAYAFISGMITLIALAVILGSITAMVAPALPTGDSIVTATFFSLTYLALLAGLLVVAGQYGIRRLHDLGLSGWFWLLTLLPLLNLFFLLYLLTAPGTKDVNKYGPPPPPNGKAVRRALVIPILVMPVLALLIAMTLNESREYRLRIHGKAARAEFSALLRELRENAISPENARAHLDKIKSGKSNARTSALEVTTSGDLTLHVHLKKPEHWKNARFILNATVSDGILHWQCSPEGRSNRPDDRQFELLLLQCQEMQGPAP